MGQGFSISQAKIYVENGVNDSPQISPINDEINIKSFDKHHPNVTVLPLSSFKNKIRVYQNFETSEVLVLLDSDISEFPGFTKSEAEEWYEVRLCHLQEKYFDFLKQSNALSSFHFDDIEIDKKNAKSKVFQQGKKYSPPPSKDKESIEIQPVSSLRLNLNHEREKVESVPPFQNVSEAFGFPTQTVSSLLTPHIDSYQSEPKDGGPCPFCKEYILGDDGLKHVCNCANSEKIQGKFVESDKLLQQVRTFHAISHVSLENRSNHQLPSVRDAKFLDCSHGAI